MSNVLISRRELVEGARVECCVRTGGSHEATVTLNEPIGGEGYRSLVHLDCGHKIAMRDGHGLFEADDKTEEV